MIKYIILLSIISYFFDFINIFLYENIILFLSFFTLVVLIFSNKRSIVHYSNENFKVQETLRFYNTFKMWYRSQYRYNNFKMLLLIKLINDILKYEIIWIDKLFKYNLITGNLNYLTSMFVNNRLSILKENKKINITNNVLDYLKYPKINIHQYSKEINTNKENYFEVSYNYINSLSRN